jgi:hypothetical protein
VRAEVLAVLDESLVVVLLGVVLADLGAVRAAEGPPMSRVLLKPLGSNFVTLDFTILTASIHSPEIELPGNGK